MSVCESCAEAYKQQQMLFYRDLYLNASLSIFEWYHCDAQQAVRALFRQDKPPVLQAPCCGSHSQVWALAVLLLLWESLGKC